MFFGHQKQWEFLKNILRENYLPQNFLFVGEDNLGKKRVAFEFVQLIFCQTTDIENRPCRQCDGCQIFQKGTHPDFYFLEPIKKEITIAQIHQLQLFLRLKPLFSSFKVIIIEKAHLLNYEAQNSFLKTLEEPSSPVIFILISHLPFLLLPTIRSRCHLVKFFPLSKIEIQKTNLPIEILDIADGRIGLAFELTNNHQEKENFFSMLGISRQILLKNNSADRFLLIQQFFNQQKNKLLSLEKSENKEKENIESISSLLAAMVFLLRQSLLQRINREEKKTFIIKTKKALQLILNAQSLLHYTEINARLLLENLVLQL